MHDNKLLILFLILAVMVDYLVGSFYCMTESIDDNPLSYEQAVTLYFCQTFTIAVFVGLWFLICLNFRCENYTNFTKFVITVLAIIWILLLFTIMICETFLLNVQLFNRDPDIINWLYVGFYSNLGLLIRIGVCVSCYVTVNYLNKYCGDSSVDEHISYSAVV